MSKWKFNIELNEVQNIQEPNIDSICAVNSNLAGWLDNGYLIASAPELLKALILIKDYENMGNHIEESVIGQVNNAINLAQGS